MGIQRPIGARAVLTVTATLAVAAGPAGAQDWPITEFEVAALRPSSREFGEGWGYFVQALRQVGIDVDGLSGAAIGDEARKNLEEYLHLTAGLLESWGFPPPMLQPVVTRSDGRRAYRVYLVEDLENAAGEYHQPICGLFGNGARESVVFLDATDVLSQGGETVPLGGFATAGHELFHAVQFGTPFFGDSCGEGIGDWITEGTAEAIGWDLVRRIWSPDLRDVEPQEVWGSRLYSDRLPVPLRRRGEDLTPHDPAYTTSSFWRFLAEDAMLGRPGPEPSSFNYGYLAFLLASPPVAHDCRQEGADCGAELRWLDGGLKRLRDKELREFFPAFLSSYALYGEHRAAPMDPAMTPEEWGLVWRGEGFDSACGLIELTPDPEGRHKTEGFSIEDVAAQCWAVSMKGFEGDVSVDVEISAPAAVPLDQLSATVAGSSRVDTAQVLRDSGSRTSWVYRWPSDEETYFLVSNVAHDAENTVPILGQILISFTALGSDFEYTGAISGEYEAGAGGPLLSGEFTGRFGVSTGSEPFPDACTVMLTLASPDSTDVVILAGPLPAPLRVGEFPILDDRSLSGPLPPGNLALQARPGCGHPEIDCSNGLPVEDARSGTFEIQRVSATVVEGEFRGVIDLDGLPAIVEGHFATPLTGLVFGRLPADHPCLPRVPATPGPGR